MNEGTGLGWLWRLGVAARFAELEGRIGKKKADRAALRALAAEKLRQGAPVTREEAAAFLGVSTKHLQRLEERGQLRRCSGCEHPVFYAARDILRLASAMGKEV